jgi:hypothetical protein
MAEMAYDRKVMGDEKVSQTTRLLQFLKQVDDLSLDRDIQSAYRFITHQQPRLDGQGPSHGQTLTLASAEFVRIASCVLRRQSHYFQQRLDPIAACPPIMGQPMNVQRLADDFESRQPRIQRTVRILENNLKATTLSPEFPAPQTCDIAAIKLNVPRSRIHKPDNGPRQGCFAAAAFTDEAKRLSLGNLKTHIVNCPHKIPNAPEQAVLNREIDL